jgi:hypothetical protein
VVVFPWFTFFKHNWISLQNPTTKSLEVMSKCFNYVDETILHGKPNADAFASRIEFLSRCSTSIGLLSLTRRTLRFGLGIFVTTVENDLTRLKLIIAW